MVKSLGVAVEHVYTVLVKKFVVDGVTQLIPFLIGLILLILGWVKLDRYIKQTPAINWHILYPDLKANAFLNKQIDIILANQAEIKQLKLDKASLNAYHFWLWTPKTN